MSTFGKTNAGVNDWNCGGATITGQKFTCSGAGTLSKISAILKYDWDSGCKAKLAVYTTASPPALVDYTGELSPGAAYGLCEGNVVLGASVSAQDYWLVVAFSASGLIQDTEDEAAQVMYYQDNTYGTFPATLASWATVGYSGENPCIYATYGTAAVSVALIGVSG